MRNGHNFSKETLLTSARDLEEETITKQNKKKINIFLGKLQERDSNNLAQPCQEIDKPIRKPNISSLLSTDHRPQGSTQINRIARLEKQLRKQIDKRHQKLTTPSPMKNACPASSFLSTAAHIIACTRLSTCTQSLRSDGLPICMNKPQENSLIMRGKCRSSPSP